MSPETIAMLVMARQAVNFLDQIGELQVEVQRLKAELVRKAGEQANEEAIEDIE